MLDVYEPVMKMLIWKCQIQVYGVLRMGWVDMSQAMSPVKELFRHNLI